MTQCFPIPHVASVCHRPIIRLSYSQTSHVMNTSITLRLRGSLSFVMIPVRHLNLLQDKCLIILITINTSINKVLTRCLCSYSMEVTSPQPCLDCKGSQNSHSQLDLYSQVAGLTQCFSIQHVTSVCRRPILKLRFSQISHVMNISTTLRQR